MGREGHRGSKEEGRKEEGKKEEEQKNGGDLQR